MASLARAARLLVVALLVVFSAAITGCHGVHREISGRPGSIPSTPRGIIPRPHIPIPCGRGLFRCPPPPRGVGGPPPHPDNGGQP
uniref:Uncharacterized protein n=1 Tax=Aegilops tauschii TaxID=37682 RepID=M8BR97_AEGTA